MQVGGVLPYKLEVYAAVLSARQVGVGLSEALLIRARFWSEKKAQNREGEILHELLPENMLLEDRKLSLKLSLEYPRGEG